MRAKEAVRSLLDRLPEDAPLEQILYHVYVMCCVAEGERAEREGQLIPHEQVMRELRDQWALRNASGASSGRAPRGDS